MTRDDSGQWRNNRERITYEEGCRVLEAQKSDIKDMDDKALRTVRVTALLLGAGVAGVQVTGTESLDSLVVVLSVVSFILSLVFGVIVYDESKEVIGPNSTYLRSLRRDSVSTDWEQDLLYQIEGWVDNNQSIVERNARLLKACQIFLILGVAFGATALLSLSLSESVLLLSAVSLVPIVVAPLLSRRAE